MKHTSFIFVSHNKRQSSRHRGLLLPSLPQARFIYYISRLVVEAIYTATKVPREEA